MSADGALREALAALIAGRDLAADQAARAFERLLSGDAPPAQIAGFLAALAVKGETAVELAAAARVIRARCVRVDCDGPLVDTCGTGGDKLGMFNVSTAAAFVAAAAGLRVAKHGNRAVSGSVGTADVLEAAGARVEMGPRAAANALREVGFCFLMAPHYHPSLKHVGPIRRDLGVPTVFNLTGPLCNPAGAMRQLIGVYDAGRAEVVAHALVELGSDLALVVHGHDGADEITPSGAAIAFEVRAGAVKRFEIDPRRFGVARCTLDDLRGGDAARNVAILRDVLAGGTGPMADAVALNAGAALYVGGACDSIEAGVARARELLGKGEGRERLERFIVLSRRDEESAAPSV